MTNNKFKATTWYKNKTIILSPHGVIKPGTVMIGKDWQNVLVYEIGNCGIESMFEIVPKPKRVKRTLTVG